MVHKGDTLVVIDSPEIRSKIAEANDINDMNLLRLCDVHNVPVATNIATAEVLIHGLERGDLDWRNIIK